MPSDWQWYLGSRDAYLRTRAEELEWNLRSNRGRAARQHRELARQQQTVNQRLNELSNDVSRLLELSDLRDELDYYVGYELVRRQVRASLASLEIVGEAGRAPRQHLAPPPPDVSEDYWLAPLARALPQVVDPAGPADLGAHPEVALARTLDPVRTDHFLLLSLVLAGRGERAVPLLPAVLGEQADGQITVQQRTLWKAAALGALGSPGRDNLLAWLRRLLDVAGQPQPAASPEEWRGRLVDRDDPFIDVPNVARGLDRNLLASLRKPIAASNALADLAERRHRGEAEWAEPLAPGGALALWNDADLAGGRVWDDLRWALITLVDEGAEDEAPLRRRAKQLRRELTGLPATPEHAQGAAILPGDLDAGVGDVGGLLMADALHRTPAGADTEPGPLADALAAVAWQAARPLLAELSHLVHALALGLPQADPSTDLEMGGATLTITGGAFPPGEIEAFASTAAEHLYPSSDGLLSVLRKQGDVSQQRERYHQRCIERAEAIGAAMAWISRMVDDARSARDAAAAALAPLEAHRAGLDA
jgi:hypothetical protein